MSKNNKKTLENLKIGKKFDFNKKIGIYRAKDKYYIFFDYSASLDSREGLGNYLGSGLTIEDAMIDGLKNLNEKLCKLAKKFEKMQKLTDKTDPYIVWYGTSEKDQTIWTDNGEVFFETDEGVYEKG